MIWLTSAASFAGAAIFFRTLASSCKALINKDYFPEQLKISLQIASLTL